MMQAHLCRMARYNRWANGRLYAACAGLDDEAYLRERGMFFGSIHGTLNHLLVGDRHWLARIEGSPSPDLRLDDRPYGTLDALRAARGVEDERIIALTARAREADLHRIVEYRRATRPDVQRTPLDVCWMHLFNHQTHHRGQVHDQLSQAGAPPPPLDLIYFHRREEPS